MMKKIVAAILFLVSLNAAAGTDRVWELAGFNELQLGELKGTVLTDRGEIKSGQKIETVDLEPVAVVWSSVKSSSGKIYFGTGYDGSIYRLDGNKAV
ncbi:MAG: hypothetical protein JXR91_04955, partial [Deltaproteobacteria bacterium]|nr:hypothetical protein [Deltaproteobacteria bacterium]